LLSISLEEVAMGHTTEAPPEDPRTIEDLAGKIPLQTSRKPTSQVPRKISRAEPVPPPVARHEIFTESLLELSSTRPPRRTVDLVLSLIVHTLLIATVILLPLYFTQTIDLTQFTRTLLVAPPPPPPPAPPSPAILKRTVAIQRVFLRGGKLLAPSAIPRNIAMLKEKALPPDLGEVGVVGGVPGGVPGGQMGGVIGGIISSAPFRAAPAAPHAAAPPEPIRVGGRVKMPRAISTPQPVYPALARQARIQGEVVIDAVIDENGNVVEMQVISGAPLLVPAAVEAMKNWKYEPTYLNGERVRVRLVATIQFRLQ
jgi:periplasmic protein TonB